MFLKISNLENTIFLIVENETKMEYFKKIFLTTEYIPKAHFVFFKPLKDMKKLASLSGCYELDDLPFSCFRYQAGLYSER